MERRRLIERIRALEKRFKRWVMPPWVRIVVPPSDGRPLITDAEADSLGKLRAPSRDDRYDEPAEALA